MKIPFVDLKSQYLGIKVEIDLAIKDVIDNTAFIGGKHVNDFEKAFAEAYGVKHCITVANGTDSLYIIMRMLGIGNGDEVITVANSWISSSETISQTGARPVFIDIDEDYYSMDVAQIESKISDKTKAIIPVHLHGQMVDMEVVLSLAKKYNLYVIEDCAQSHFSELNGSLAGTMGIAGSFSFYPGKNLGAYGDAGCIVTNDDILAEKCRMFARHGALQKHKHAIEGINSRMDGLQAAILNTKLPYILKWTNMRIQNSKKYDQCLSGVGDVILPKVKPQTKHTFHLYIIRTNFRDELQEYLMSQGIETAIHYPTILPELPAYKYLDYSPEDFPVASKFQYQILSLPMYPELTNEQIVYICESIRNFFILNNY